MPSTAPAFRAAAIAATVALAVMLAPFLAYCVARVPRATPIDYNEGWNAYRTTGLLRGEPLYPAVDGWPVAPNNYPPLSFVVFAAFARWTHAPVLTGRVVSLASLLCVTVLAFVTIVGLTASRQGAALGTLLWLCLLVRLAPANVGSYDEQMLGLVFPAGALYLYVRWRAGLGSGRLWLLALLCCLGVFVKHVLVAVPLALAIALMVESRPRFVTFSSAGVVLFTLLALGTRVLGGPHVLENLLSFDRVMEASQQDRELSALFLESRAALLCLLPLALLASLGRRAAVLIAYFGVALLVGGVAVRGVGVDRNVWFEFFFASALAVGVLVGEALVGQRARDRVLATLAVTIGMLPAAAHYRSDLPGVLDYAKLRREEEAYRRDVELLKGLPGPALFEEPLLGFDAGKELRFDPFIGSQMILSGRLPESFLTGAVERQEFAVIVLTTRDVEESRRRPRRAGHRPADEPPTRAGWWTRRLIEAVRDHYTLHDPGRRRYAFFYLPAS
jgi:hypothetical protein